MRKLAVLLHRYIGLALAAFLLVSAISGSVLVFKKPIDIALNPSLLEVKPQPARVPLDILIANARSMVADARASNVFLQPRPDQAVEVWFKDSMVRVYLDPYTGEVLGVRNALSSLTGFLLDLHVHLLSGETGESVMGWAGIGSILLSTIGLYLWWPRAGRWRQALTVKWTAAPVRVWLDLHKVTGAVAFSLIVMTALTGSALALYEIVTEPLLIALTGQGARNPAPRSSAALGRAPAPVAPMLEHAQRLFPDAHLTRVTLPGKADAAVGVRLRLQGEIHQFGRSFVWFDQYDGRVLRVDNALKANAATRIQAWLFPLHSGAYGGLATQWLQVLAGIALAMLSASGIWLWWKGWRARSLSRTRARSAISVRT